MMHQLPHYDLSFEGIPTFCDNTSAVSLSKYTTHHSRDKNIYIKHHFICNHVESDFLLEFINSENQLADIFTKTLLEEIFYFFRECRGLTFLIN